MRLVDRYRARPSEEWAPLFFRILQRRIVDTYRRQAVRRAVFGLFQRDPDGADKPLEDVAGPATLVPEAQLASQQSLQQLENAIRALPLRQQQVFLLREWQGFDVKETATIVGCSTGSVKTHYSRARQKLRELLTDCVE